ncbi:MAG: hypothetical protein A2Z24_02070 [Candidatus Woykebacteria bacterium RBG_16_44_10]|uniref:LTD domain-containing protein n=1 Tax=Candidatus Woykebacteria bacterium RBG_16_44_10 TaxID=1802597 RepID=A0A1G1WF81_9BACT|nr:MAG: hypothetical protein A2Z24_02070 [Candidatus Woykebacteria bacterium RBG_16_44_10]
MLKLVSSFIIATGGFLYLSSQPVLAQTDSIKINEFAAVTDGNSTDPDWVELYNLSNNQIGLEGGSLKDSTTNETKLSGCIGSLSFRKFNISYYNRLNNSGDQIRLFDAGGNLVDAITYFSEQIPSHINGSSTSRNPDGSGNWQVLVSPTPTNSACTSTTDTAINSSLKVSLSEVYPNPEKGSDEWVEIHNPNSSSVNLEGWFFSDSANHKKSLSGSLSPKSYKFFSFSSGWLNNSGDTLNLLDSAGKLVEKYSFGSMDKGLSLAKDATNKWRFTSTPTPGKPNIITGETTSSSPGGLGTDQDEADTFSSTGLDPTFDYLGETFTFSNPDEASISTTKGKVAGVSEQKDTKGSLTTLLIAAGFAFLGTAVVWPFLEKKKLL